MQRATSSLLLRQRKTNCSLAFLLTDSMVEFTQATCSQSVSEENLLLRSEIKPPVRYATDIFKCVCVDIVRKSSSFLWRLLQWCMKQLEAAWRAHTTTQAEQLPMVALCTLLHGVPLKTTNRNRIPRSINLPSFLKIWPPVYSIILLKDNQTRNKVKKGLTSLV